MTFKSPFPLAIITDEVSQEPEVFVKLAVKYGLSSLEIRSVWNSSPQNLSGSQISDLKKIALDNDLEFCGISAPFLKCNYNSLEEYTKHLDILKKCCNLANELNCKIIRGFTFWREAGLVNNIDPVIDKFGEVVKILEETDKILAIENEPSTNTGTGAETAYFISKINHPRIKAIWDPANCIYSEVKEKPFPDGYEIINPYIIHVHIKDALRDENNEPQCVLVGEGNVDWKGQIIALLKDGYKGILSLETHWRPAHLSEKELNLPGGNKFSEDGEYASSLCLENLYKIMEEI